MSWRGWERATDVLVGVLIAAYAVAAMVAWEDPPGWADAILRALAAAFVLNLLCELVLWSRRRAGR